MKKLHTSTRRVLDSLTIARRSSCEPESLRNPLLPPEPEDVEWFRQRRRKEITRRAFVVGGIAAGIGVAVLPFLPWSAKPDPQRLLDPAIANADPQTILQLCQYFHQHPAVEIRTAVAVQLGGLEQYQAAKSLLWKMVRTDPATSIREKAMHSLVWHASPADHAAIASHYRDTPALRGTIDTAAMMLGLSDLQAAIAAAMK